MWTSYFAQLLQLVMFAVMISVSRELDDSRRLNPGSSEETKGESAFGGLSPQRREWAEKSVAGYIRQQERKWRRWDEVMFKARRTGGS